MAKPEVARGIGPVPFRIGLAGCALVYFVMLLKHPTPQGWIRQIAYFSECTGLFTQADPVASEYRLDAWSCDRHAWEPLDPRPYFPIRADDKEARFQRVAHFYKRERVVMNALDDYITGHHTAAGDAAEDGVRGPIGGIRLYQIERPIPPVASDIDRYHYDPLGPIPANATRFDLFHTRSSIRKTRCGGESGAGSASDQDKDITSPGSAVVNDPWGNQ